MLPWQRCCPPVHSPCCRWIVQHQLNEQNRGSQERHNRKKSTRKQCILLCGLHSCHSNHDSNDIGLLFSAESKGSFALKMRPCYVLSNVHSSGVQRVVLQSTVSSLTQSLSQLSHLLVLSYVILLSASGCCYRYDFLVCYLERT